MVQCWSWWRETGGWCWQNVKAVVKVSEVGGGLVMERFELNLLQYKAP